MTRLSTIVQAIRIDPLRVIGYGLAGGVATTLMIGIPTVLIPNPWFSRMTPVRPQDYVFLVLTALLAAALTASYALPAACPLQEGKLTAGGMLSFMAVGCPVCNKIVVLAIGMSGAMSYFQPIQPLLGLVSLALLGFGLRLRLRAIVPPAALTPAGD